MSEDRDLSGLTEPPKRKDRQVNRPPPRRRSRPTDEPTESSGPAATDDNRGGGVADRPTADPPDSGSAGRDGEISGREPPDELVAPHSAGALALDEHVVKKNVSIAGSLKNRLEEAAAAERLSYGELILDAADRYGDRLPFELTDDDRHWFARRRRRRRRGSGIRTVVGAYLTPTEWARIDRLASNVGMDRSTFVAEVLRRRLGLSRDEAHSG